MTRDDNYALSRRSILAGLGTVGIASAGAGLGTTAFFNDEEELSAALQAGRMDLLLDYRSEYYPWEEYLNDVYPRAPDERFDTNGDGVIDDADEKSLVEVAEELNATVEAAREREISPADLQGGTFTVTNTGSHGGHGTFGTPIIRHPEAAIMGVGAIEETPVAVDGELTVQERIGFSFSYDHRLVDGVTAGQFMEHVIEGIEDPDILLSRL